MHTLEHQLYLLEQHIDSFWNMVSNYIGFTLRVNHCYAIGPWTFNIVLMLHTCVGIYCY